MKFGTIAKLNNIGDILLTGDGGRTRYTLKQVVIEFALITLPILIILCLVVLNVISQQELNINCFEFIKLLIQEK